MLAPGKLFLAGEYAVLDGGVAVVAAASRYALAQFQPGMAPGIAAGGGGDRARPGAPSARWRRRCRRARPW